MTNDEVHADIYDKVNENTEQIKELLGQFKIITAQNEKLIDLLRKALNYMFVTIVFLLGVVTYGALGEKGFNSVKNVLPSSSHSDITANIPGNNELEQWIHHQNTTKG